MKDLMLDDKMDMLVYIIKDFLKKKRNIVCNITYDDLEETDDTYIMLIQIKDYAKIYFVNKQKLKDNLAIDLAEYILKGLNIDLEF